jgi:hypothetical protein
VLTRQPVEGRAFTVDEPLAALDPWRAACVVLEELAARDANTLDLARFEDETAAEALGS